MSVLPKACQIEGMYECYFHRELSQNIGRPENSMLSAMKRICQRSTGSENKMNSRVTFIHTRTAGKGTQTKTGPFFLRHECPELIREEGNKFVNNILLCMFHYL